MRFILVILLCTAAACSRHDTRRAETSEAAARHRPSLVQADSLLNRYLGLIVERDNFAPEQFAGIHSDEMSCVEEMFGDAISSYWLARGRVLGYQPDGDTLRARLELVTVAAQEPSDSEVYGSNVTARIRTDTLFLKLVPDSTRRAWQICGQLSDSHTLGGYGRPENVHYLPRGVSRMSLLRQVDSIRRDDRRRR